MRKGEDGLRVGRVRCSQPALLPRGLEDGYHVAGFAEVGVLDDSAAGLLDELAQALESTLAWKHDEWASRAEECRARRGKALALAWARHELCTRRRWRHTAATQIGGRCRNKTHVPRAASTKASGEGARWNACRALRRRGIDLGTHGDGVGPSYSSYVVCRPRPPTLFQSLCNHCLSAALHEP